MEVKLAAGDLPLRGSPGHGEAKEGDTRAFAVCVPAGYRMVPPGALGQTLFEPNEGPVFSDRTLAFANIQKPRVRFRVTRALERETVSEARARESAFDSDRTATVRVNPWGITVKKSVGARTDVFVFARLATKPPLASMCHVGFGVAKGEAAKAGGLVAQAEAICASLRGE